MNLNLIRLLAGATLFACPLILAAQEKKYSFNEDKSELSLIVEKERTKSHVIDADDTKSRGLPLVEAKLYTLDILTDTVGVWSVSPAKENIWKLTLEVPDAKGFFIGFDNFYLPEGSQLYVYNKNNLKNAIVYQYNDNPKGAAYSIENLNGDNVVLEYVAREGLEKPRLHISDLGYKYVNGQSDAQVVAGFESSASCMINVNCPEGDFWQNQKKGVLQLRIKRNSDSKAVLCSGTLINNTNNDKTPYVLTAYHCYEYMSSTAITNTEFIFEYETSECVSGADAPKYKYHKGAIPLVLNPVEDGSDGVLLKLSEPIPDDWDVYYNGWNRTNEGAKITGGTIIHHPLGDVKKITLYNNPLTSDKWSDDALGDTHWLTSYFAGATQGGSSGGPIFDQNGYVIGTLTGGKNSCSNRNLPDYYGKLWYHWDQYPDENLHMSKYLDPNNTGVTQLKGISALGTDKPDPNKQPDIIAYFENDMLNISVKDTIKKIRIADLSGQEMYSKIFDLNSFTHTIPVYGWRGGVYILSVDVIGQSTKSIKIIK